MIYLDYAASTPPFTEVLDLFVSLNQSTFGNSSSEHGFGAKASKTLEKARADLLKALSMSSDFTCVFTSGASESNNMAIKGVASSYKNRGRKLLFGGTEHPSVSSSFEQLAEFHGFEIVKLPVDKDGLVKPEVLEKNMGPDVTLVSIMAVNNETGAVNDIKSLSDVVHKYPKAFFHVDATQSIGKVDVDYNYADLFSFSGHKIGGLKGTGALVYKKKIRILPLVSGGNQEFGIRSGTVNVPGAASLAFALEKAMQIRPCFYEKAVHLKSILVKELLSTGELTLNSPENSCPFVTNFSFIHHKASVIEEYLSEREIYVSSFSACSTKIARASQVLLAMGKSEEEAENSMRVSIGLNTTEEDILSFAKTLKNALKEIKTR